MNRLGAQIAAAIAAHLAASGMSQADLAREMGVSPKHVNQILTGKATGSPGLLDFAAFALGCEWHVELREVPHDARGAES